jgi:hypothetical protein
MLRPCCGVFEPRLVVAKYFTGACSASSESHFLGCSSSAPPRVNFKAINIYGDNVEKIDQKFRRINLMVQGEPNFLYSTLAMANISITHILFLTLPVFAQNIAPQWIEESWRVVNYPNAEWYMGFAKDKIENEPNSIAYETIEKEAQSKLSQNITVHIQSISATEQASEQTQNGKNISETINKNYRQEITSTSNTVLAKVETHSYFDKKTGYIYGFAVAKKKDLANFYKSKISSLFFFADKEFTIAEQQAEQGRKKFALDKIYAIEDSLKSIGYWASFLQAVENDNSHAEQEKILWQKANGLKMQFQNGTSVYLDISGDYSNDLDGRLRAQMQEKGCNCAMAETKEEADYLVTIKTKLSRCIEAGGAIFCWANATAEVNNLKLKKPVSLNIPEAKGGWAKGDKTKATEEAFKKLTGFLAEKISQSINQ